MFKNQNEKQKRTSQVKISAFTHKCHKSKLEELTFDQNSSKNLNIAFI